MTAILLRSGAALGDVSPPGGGLLPAPTITDSLLAPDAGWALAGLMTLSVVIAFSVAIVVIGMMLHRIRCPQGRESALVLFRRGIDPGPDRVLYCPLRRWRTDACRQDCVAAWRTGSSGGLRPAH